MPTSFTTRRRVHYALVVAGAASLAIMATLGFGRFSYPVILPAMQPALGLNSTQSGLLATANLFGFLPGTFLGGILAGRIGVRRVILVGMCVTAAGLVLVGVSPTVAPAIAAQWLAGVGTGVGSTPSMGLSAVWFARTYRGRASGFIAAGSGPGMLISGLVLPPLIALAGWRAAWFLLAAMVLGLALVCRLALRDHPRQVGLAPLGAKDMAVAVQARPGTWRLVAGRPILWHLGLVFGLFGLSYSSYATFFPTYLVHEAGFSQAAAGGLWGLTGTMGFVGSVLWGMLADAIGRRLALALVFVIFAIAFLSSALAPGPLGYYVAPALFGLTFWATPTIVAAAAADYFGDRLVFPSLGLMHACSGAGQSIGPSLAGLAADLSGTYTTAFLLATAASLTALTASVLLPPPPTGTQ